MKPIPPELLDGPFSRARALELGVTSRMLQGNRFARVLPGVWRCSEHVMTQDDWLDAAALVLPAKAHLTAITRLQQAGLDFGPRLPLHFVIEGDHHLAYDEIFLHRTKGLPPTDACGVTIPAAFLAYCARARVIDAIQVGDWLLHNRCTTIDEIRDLGLSGLWRDGAYEAVWILDHLDGRSRSFKESETRSVLEFAGLPRPEANVSLRVDDEVILISDLVYRTWRTVVEYDGSQHQEDRAQYVTDIERYAIYRSYDISYIQVTKEKLDRARSVVGEVFRELVRRGYDGPPPSFGERWRLLFASCATAAGPRSERYRSRQRSRGLDHQSAVS